MGLIMLILIGTVPTAYAVNHALTYEESQDFIAVSHDAANVLDRYVNPSAVIAEPRDDVKEYVRARQFTPDTMMSLRNLVNDIGTETANFKELAAIPEDQVRNFRNDMYLVSESLRLMKKTKKPPITAADWKVLDN
jgi:inorganic phosphate transporter, PiT family